jgi:hypothetical protein
MHPVDRCASLFGNRQAFAVGTVFRQLVFAAALLSAGLATGVSWAGDLLHGIRIEPEAKVSYDRARDYGGWRTKDCMSTRMIVLRDESEPERTQIRKKENGSCDVWIGLWHDPYTGTDFTDPRKLDIDHLVPLKQAHLSGAHKWSKAKRKDYANYLADEWHLLAVSLSENRSKSDQDPATWLPPNENFVCTYLAQWIAVKRKWELSMDERERASIIRNWSDHSCDQ